MKTIILIAAVLLGLFPQTLEAKCASEASDNILREKADTTGTAIITVNSSTDRIHIYPNPSRGAFYFNGVKGHSIEIQNAFGLVIYNAEADRDRYPIDLSSRGKGFYSYRIFDQGALVQQGKLVVE
jgi:hypothetical protein